MVDPISIALATRLDTGIGKLSGYALKAAVRATTGTGEQEAVDSPEEVAQQDLLKAVQDEDAHRPDEKELAEAVESGLVERSGDRVNLTPLGAYLASAEPTE